VDSPIKNYARHTHEIKFRIAVTKAEFNKKRALFATNLDLILEETN
jgi:hypothetical protein